MESYKAEIKKIPGCIIYYKDYFAPSLESFFNFTKDKNFLQDLSDRVMKENPHIQLVDPDYNVLIYMDGEFRDKEVHYRFCDAVTGFGKDCEAYQFGELEPVTVVSVLHKGPYRNLGRAHMFARSWIKEHGYEQAGPPRDSAIDGCWNREREEEYLTEIQIPVRKVR